MENEEIFGCFVSGPPVFHEDPEEIKLKTREKGKDFRTYIWGENSISNILKELKYQDYGRDLKLILFQFYLNPIDSESYKDVEPYRKREKSIGISIIVTDENFFNKSEEEKRGFLRNSIVQKLSLLSDVIKRKKLDTNLELLKADLERLFLLQ